MTGEIIIDGINATTTYGIIVRDGDYAGIISMPKIKEPEANDWPEEDGLEVDLSDLKYERKEFDIRFATISPNADINGFINLLIDGAYHDVTFSDLGITKQIRLLAGKNFKGSILKMRLFTLRFSEDNPMSGYTYQEPTGGEFPEQGYKIDTKDISQYGIAVLQGSEEEILKIPEVKQNLTIDTTAMNGAIYDPEQVKMKAKDVRLKLLATAGSAAALMRNLNAFFYDLTRPGERELYFNKNEETYSAYYQEMNVGRLAIGKNKIWCEFDTTLRFISYRIKRYIYLIKMEGWLKATDTSYMQNQGIILFSKVDPGTDIDQAITLSKSYDKTTGKITIDATSTIKDIDMTYSNGKLYMQ